MPITDEKSEREVVSFIKSIISNGQNLSEVPFYVIDFDDVREKMEKWNRQLPRVHPFYAVKCNHDPKLLKILNELGCGFDVASKNEIEKVFEYTKVKTNDLIFANPCKLSSHLKFAAASDVALMTFDNSSELEKIKKFYPEAKVVLRMATDDSESLMKLSDKYGAKQSEWLKLIIKCQELKLNLVGVAFHVGSMVQDSKQFYNSLSDARNVFDLAAEHGFELTLLDIGGGFPGCPKSRLEPGAPTFDELSFQINSGLDQFFNSESDLENIRIIAEPGRFFAASAFTLVTQVIAKRNETESTRYFLNDGIYGSFNGIIFDHQNPKPKLVYQSQHHKIESECSFWGPTCDSLDKIKNNFKFCKLDCDDYIMWFDMGAYTLSTQTVEFNGMPSPSRFYFNENNKIEHH